AALGCVVAVLGIPVAARVMAALDVTRPAALDGLLVPEGGVDGRESLALWFALSGVRRRARCAAALLFPSPGFMTMEYGVTGRAGLALAYSRRARHLLWQGLRGTARLLRHI